jgi:signal transduction histidine kinase
MVSSEELANWIYIGTGFTFVLALGILLLSKKNQRIQELSDKLIKETEEKKELEKLEVAISAQEKERVEIGRQLHDDVGALLSFAQKNLVNFEDNSEDGEVDYNSIGMAKEYLAESIQLIRHIAKGLTPQYLMKFGLVKALDNMTKQKSGTLIEKFDFTSNVPEELTIAELISTHYYYIAGELITNLFKHSYPTEIHMELTYDKQLLKLNISHNGIALTQRDFTRLLSESDSLGLENINYRLNVINGEVFFKRLIDHGTIELITKLDQTQMKDGGSAEN